MVVNVIGSSSLLCKQVRYPYHVRVLVPCYKESLEILRRTIMAAYDAQLPEGCHRTIYLCDDGKDPKKRKWVDSLAADVVYVSGRKRLPGRHLAIFACVVTITPVIPLPPCIPLTLFPHTHNNLTHACPPTQIYCNTLSCDLSILHTFSLHASRSCSISHADIAAPHFARPCRFARCSLSRASIRS